VRPAPTGSPDDICGTLRGSVPCHNLAWPNGNPPAVPNLRTGRRWSEAWYCSSRHQLLRRAFGSLPGFGLLDPWDAQVLNLRKRVGGWAWRIHPRPPVVVDHFFGGDGRSPRSDSGPYFVGQSVRATRHQQSPPRGPFVASSSGPSDVSNSLLCAERQRNAPSFPWNISRRRIRGPDPSQAGSIEGRQPYAMPHLSPVAWDGDPPISNARMRQYRGLLRRWCGRSSSLVKHRPDCQLSIRPRVPAIGQ
jgi:hypothetical protein